MATLDITKGADAIPFGALGQDFVVAVPLVVADIIAADATMTANGYITIADVLQVFDVPVGCIVTKTCLRTVVAGTASATCDIGIAGSQVCDAGVALDATAGTVVVSTVADANQDDWIAGDTVDVEILTANLAAGSYILYIHGTRLWVPASA